MGKIILWIHTKMCLRKETFFKTVTLLFSFLCLNWNLRVVTFLLQICWRIHPGFTTSDPRWIPQDLRAPGGREQQDHERESIKSVQHVSRFSLKPVLRLQIQFVYSTCVGISLLITCPLIDLCMRPVRLSAIKVTATYLCAPWQGEGHICLQGHCWLYNLLLN